MNVKPYDLRRRLYIIMRGEEGLDYGGIARWDTRNSSPCEQRGFPFQGLDFLWILNVGVCVGVGAVFFTFCFFANCKISWFLFLIFLNLSKIYVWILGVSQRLRCESLLLFLPLTHHPTLSSLSSLPHSIPTFIHHTDLSLSLFLPFSGSSFLHIMSFFLPPPPPRWQWSRVFPLWFCIVSLSLVSRQWFYPMVGDIMLFYHRVEPRTGCWRVSASIRQSIPTSFHKPQIEGSGCGDGARGVAAGGPSITLTCICLSVLLVLFHHVYIAFILFVSSHHLFLTIW